MSTAARVRTDPRISRRRRAIVRSRRRRMVVTAALSVGCFLALFTRLVHLQVAERPAYAARAEANRLRVVRQVRYPLDSEHCIDLVLYLNGVPVATVELKTERDAHEVDVKAEVSDEPVYLTCAAVTPQHPRRFVATDHRVRLEQELKDLTATLRTPPTP